MHQRQACWHLDCQPVVPGRDLEVGQDRNASAFSSRVKTFHKYIVKRIKNSHSVISLVRSVYLSSCLYIFRPQQNKNNSTFSQSYLQWIDFILNHFKHALPKITIEKYFACVGAVLPSWQGQREEEQLANLRKTCLKPETRIMQEYERHQRDLPEKWRCSLFTSLCRSTHQQRQEESLQNVSWKRSCTRLSAVTLSSCVLVSVNHCIIEGEQNKTPLIDKVFPPTYLRTISSKIA